MIRRFTACTLLIVIAVLFSTCKKVPDLPAIIPIPQQLTWTGGRFLLNAETKIELDRQNPEMLSLGELIQSLLPPEAEIESKGQNGRIRIHLQENSKTNREAYSLTVTREEILIEASTNRGLFYGIQTLRQLTATSRDKGSIPCLSLRDSPRFPWRGLHLDCCRHFMPPAFIKKYLDDMALYKLNIFHWHLTDDQGWRMEIKAFPRLTEIGAFRRESRDGHAGEKPARFDSTPHGGFYTQEEIREIVAYAADRFITVVPELEMPGHAQAAIAAYPELGCTGENVEVWTDWGVSPYIFNLEESTFAFLEKVIDEMVELFPGPYFHVGGDEAVKNQWQSSPRIRERMKELGIDSEAGLQSYFIARMEKHINEKGKQLIGWDEILEGGLAPNAAIMSWRGIEGGIAAARAGHHAVMCPGSHCYYDHYQADPETEPLAIGGYTPLIKAYQFDPVPPGLTQDEARFILGGQANLWTEYIPTPEHAEYMLFPRITALAEAVWSLPERKNWTEFKKRVERHLTWYARLGVHACSSTLNAPLDLGKKREK